MESLRKKFHIVKCEINSGENSGKMLHNVKCGNKTDSTFHIVECGKFRIPSNTIPPIQLKPNHIELTREISREWGALHIALRRYW